MGGEQPGIEHPHVLVVLPSYSVAETLLAHYAARIPPLEHRYLLACLLLGRSGACELVFVTCQDPGSEILDPAQPHRPGRWAASALQLEEE